MFYNKVVGLVGRQLHSSQRLPKLDMDAGLADLPRHAFYACLHQGITSGRSQLMCFVISGRRRRPRDLQPFELEMCWKWLDDWEICPWVSKQ